MYQEEVVETTKTTEEIFPVKKINKYKSPGGYLCQKRLEDDDFVKIELNDDKQHPDPNAVDKSDDVPVISRSRSLSLSGKRLRSLPVVSDSLIGLQWLEKLDLSCNLLNSLPDSIGLLENLKVLDVSRNDLNALPKGIENCRSLVELDASFNNIMFLPSNFGHGLVNLTRLSLHLNKIRYIPVSVCEMVSLRYMYVHFNNLHSLPSDIGKLKHLEVLNLSSNFNYLTNIPESIGELTNLRELDLSNNQIRALPDTFSQLVNITKLKLDQNPLEFEITGKGTKAVIGGGFMIKRHLINSAVKKQNSNFKAVKQIRPWRMP